MKSIEYLESVIQEKRFEYDVVSLICAKEAVRIALENDNKYYEMWIKLKNIISDIEEKL